MRWLLTSWGSRGDLHPFLALGRGLLARGHRVTLVGHSEWAGETVAAGLRFVDSGEAPRENFLQRHPQILSPQWGGLPALQVLVREGMVPGFDATLAALEVEARHHDVLIAHHFAFVAPIAAELAKIPLVTVCLAPGVVPSAYTRPGPDFGVHREGVLPRLLNRFQWAGGKVITRALVDPVVNRLRRSRGLPPVRGAMFEAHSKRLNLQLYSPHFAPAAPDWSREKRQSGFCFFDPPGLSLSDELEAFLQQGESPVLFTLGSAAVQLPGNFYRVAVESLTQLGLRGLLLIGPEENRPTNLPKSILATSYVNYGLIMPRTRAVVHQCGIGTLSHVLRAGLPSIACPFAFDQPNNARRLEALGVAEMLPPQKLTGARLMGALQRLLAGEASVRARHLGELLRAEDGVGRSCDILEQTSLKNNRALF